MKKLFCCADLGIDCHWEGSAETVEDLLKIVAEHARSAHNMKELNESMRLKIIGKMHEIDN
jgi:predicted small metal-binding protein